MTPLVILVPMLGRAEHVAPLVESIRRTCDARVLFLVSPDDDEVDAAIDAVDGERLVVEYRARGDYARKINAGYRATTEPLLFLGASDLRFHPGWFEAATAQLAPGIGVVGTNDLGSPRVMRGEHATHSLVTREYVAHFGTIDQVGLVLHEGYVHEYCDDELVGTAKHRGAWAFADDSHVEHLHPDWGKGERDAMYADQRRRMARSIDMFKRRRRLWT